jgi:hypothetical protein
LDADDELNPDRAGYQHGYSDVGAVHAKRYGLPYEQP